MKKKEEKTFKNYFDNFPPILREMVMEAMDEDKANGDLFYMSTPLMWAFSWYNNKTFSDFDFWAAVEADAIHHKIWERP